MNRSCPFRDLKGEAICVYQDSMYGDCQEIEVAQGNSDAWCRTQLEEKDREIERLREQNCKNSCQPDVAKELDVWLRQYGIETPEGGYALNLPYIGPAIRKLVARAEKAEARVKEVEKGLKAIQDTDCKHCYGADLAQSLLGGKS